jgi:hypothetical protein
LLRKSDTPVGIKKNGGKGKKILGKKNVPNEPSVRALNMPINSKLAQMQKKLGSPASPICLSSDDDAKKYIRCYFNFFIVIQDFKFSFFS